MGLNQIINNSMHQKNWRELKNHKGEIWGKEKRFAFWVTILIGFMLSITAILTWWFLYGFKAEMDKLPKAPQSDITADFCTLPYISCPGEKLLVNKPSGIVGLIKAYTSRVPDETAITIATCESQLDPSAKNPNSSATGLFQFTKLTWDNYCKGDRLDPVAQTKCFDKLYSKFPSWWECKA